MNDSLIERLMENALRDVFGDKAKSIVKSFSRMAAKQGGESTIENYQLLGKRALVAFIAALVAAQAVSSVVNYVISRKNEERRMEKVARRVLEEERQKAEAESAAQAKA